jgi:hypothetical protein
MKHGPMRRWPAQIYERKAKVSVGNIVSALSWKPSTIDIVYDNKFVRGKADGFENAFISMNIYKGIPHQERRVAL